MSKLILILAAHLFAFTAFADSYGLPPEDPVVEALMTRFIQAKETVKIEVLKDKELKCKKFTALPGNFEKHAVSFKASEVTEGIWSGQMIVATPSGEKATRYNMTYTQGNPYSNTLVGVINRDSWHEKFRTPVLYFRQSGNNLYIEETLKKKYCSSETSPYWLSRGNDSCSVFTAYAVCPLK